MRVTRVYIPHFVDLGARAFPGKPSQLCARTRGRMDEGLQIGAAEKQSRVAL